MSISSISRIRQPAFSSSLNVALIYFSQPGKMDFRDGRNYSCVASSMKIRLLSPLQNVSVSPPAGAKTQIT